MSTWIAQVAVVVANVAMVVIRAPHGQRSRSVEITDDRKGRLEVVLLTLAWVSFFVPLVWVVSPVFSFAEYPLHVAPFASGVVLIVVGLWLFYRSHADLGTNWSITLQMREGHQLITNGVFRYVRHPMYSALLLFYLGQALVLPNWVAGPVALVVFAVLVACRLRVEEAMMLDQFDEEYASYQKNSRRLIPGIW